MVQGMYYSLQILQKYPGDEFQLKFRLTRIATYDFLTKIGLETLIAIFEEMEKKRACLSFPVLL